MNTIHGIMVILVMTLCGIVEAQPYLAVKKDGKYGYVDTSGTWVVPPKYDYATLFVRDKGLVSINDSVFLFAGREMLQYFPGVKAVQDHLHGLKAVQDISGKWALADSNYKLLTEFRFNRLQVNDDHIVFEIGRLKGLMNLDAKLLVDAKFKSIHLLSNGQFMGYIDTTVRILDVKDGYKEILEAPSIRYDERFPFVYSVKSKNRMVKSELFNMQGKLIFEGFRFNLEMMVHEMLVIKGKGKYHIIQTENGGSLMEVKDTSGLIFDARKPGLILLKNKIYSSGNESPILDDPNIDSVAYLNEKYFLVRKSGFWGICDYQSNFVLPAIYNDFELVDSALVNLYQNQSISLYHLDFKREVLNYDLGYSVIYEFPILWLCGERISTYYEFDSLFNVIDSAKYGEVAVIKAGRRIGVRRSATNDFTIANNYPSKCQRWFNFKDKFGLKGFNSDTLLRPVFERVYGYNDSIDIVVLKTGNYNILYIDGVGVANLKKNYCVVNNRTGKFKILPNRIIYVDIEQAMDSALDVFRVIMVDGRYALMKKSNFEVINSTKSQYISPAKDGYMRLFMKAVFKSKERVNRYSTSQIFYSLGDMSDLSKSGLVYSRHTSEILVLGKGVNIADRHGELMMDTSLSMKLKFIDTGCDRRFITIDSKDSFGVFDCTAGILLKNSYRKIRRFERHGHFLMHTNVFRMGYLRTDGTELTDPIFHQAQEMKGGYAWASIGDSMLIVDSTGLVIDPSQNKLKTTGFSEGVTAVKYRKGWQFVDIKGNIIIDEYYKKTSRFIEGTAAVQTRKGWGIIDGNGNWIQEPQYESLTAENLKAFVFQNGKYYYFHDRSGKLHIKIKAKGTIKSFGDSYFKITENNKHQVYNADGTVFSKRKFRQDLVLLGDSVVAFTNKKMLNYGIKGKMIEKLDHNGGLRSIIRGTLDFKSNRMRERYLEMDVSEAHRKMYPGVYPESGKLILYRPEVNYVTVLENLNMQHCVRLNAFVYKLTATELGQTRKILVDSLGNLLNDNIFHDIVYAGNDLFKVKLMNDEGMLMTGLINKNGLWVVYPKYNGIMNISENVAVYSKFTDFKVCDENGMMISDKIFKSYAKYGSYYCFYSENMMAWWHPARGWISQFSE